MKLLRLFSLIAIASLLPFLVACESDDGGAAGGSGSTRCDKGDTKACACTNGATGTKVCGDDERWEACSCAGSSGADTVGGQDTTGGNQDTTTGQDTTGGTDTSVQVDGGGGGPIIDDECINCVESSCGSELQGCQMDSGCSALLECMYGCADEDCMDACVSANMAGAQGFMPLGECIGEHCDSVCDAEGGSGPCTPDCTNQQCGDDGCDGSCGSCNDGMVCVDGWCQEGGGGDYTDCEGCTMTECASEIMACQNNSDCSGLLMCMQECGSSESCLEMCASEYPGGTTASFYGWMIQPT